MSRGGAGLLRQRLAADGVAVTNCPVCHSTDRRRASATTAGTQILQCRGCGLRYASHVLPAAARVTLPPWASAGVSAGAGSRDEFDLLEQASERPGRLLCVTDAAAPLVSCAARRGWDATVVNFDAFTCDGPSEPQLDAVWFAGTLERAPDPVALLRRVREHHMRRGGHLLVDAVNVHAPARYLRRARWDEWRPGLRVTYPEPLTLRQILQRAGFQVQVLRSQRYGPQTSWLDRHGFGTNLVALGRAV